MDTLQTILSLELVKSQIGWDEATPRAQRWWRDLEKLNEDRLELVLELGYELLQRRRSIDDFFQVFIYSNSDSITENLKFLDLVCQDQTKPGSSGSSDASSASYLH